MGSNDVLAVGTITAFGQAAELMHNARVLKSLLSS
jgi:hypothetical protein